MYRSGAGCEAARTAPKPIARCSASIRSSNGQIQMYLLRRLGPRPGWWCVVRDPGGCQPHSVGLDRHEVVAREGHLTIEQICPEGCQRRRVGTVQRNGSQTYVRHCVTIGRRSSPDEPVSPVPPMGMCGALRPLPGLLACPATWLRFVGPHRNFVSPKEWSRLPYAASQGGGCVCGRARQHGRDRSRFHRRCDSAPSIRRGRFASSEVLPARVR